MAVQLGDVAPDFYADSSQGKIQFHEWAGSSWVVLFSHPQDFTPLYATELSYVAQLKPEFDKRNAKAIGLSVGNDSLHLSESEAAHFIATDALNFPIVADPKRIVAIVYGMLHPLYDASHTVRTVFVIDPHKRIRLSVTYPQCTGWNFDEILRVIDSLQLTERHAVATPVNWHRGEEVLILPSVSDADASGKFPKGWRALSPYLRVTPDPGNY